MSLWRQKWVETMQRAENTREQVLCGIRFPFRVIATVTDCDIT